MRPSLKLTSTFLVLLAGVGLGRGAEPRPNPNSASASIPQAPLLGHWKLSADARDSSGNGRHGENHGVVFENGSARFDGRSSFLSIKPQEKLTLGRRDFTIALWVHTADVLDDDLGDLISQRDFRRRTGFQLGLRCNTGVASSQANWRQLQFGIDRGTEPQWTNEGRPGRAILAFAMAVHDGALYAGTCEPGKGETGRVYRYDGPNRWIDCGAPDRSNSVSALAAYEGKLYAGTSKYRLAGSSLTESENPELGGKVLRYDGGERWTDCGQLPNTEAIGGLTVFRGKLYASSLYRPAGFFRYEGGRSWTAMPTPAGKRVEALGSYNGGLWATGYDEGHIYRFDGERWSDLGGLGENTQTYSFAMFRGGLHVGTWPSGRVYRYSDKGSWEDRGRLGEELEVMGMLEHNGGFYAGTLPSGSVYRDDGNPSWSLAKRLDLTPDVKYRRVWTMAQFQGRLFCSTLPSGQVHSMKAGEFVTVDRELPSGWRHVAAVRESGRLRLYVDGKLAAQSSAPFDPKRYDLDLADQPILIGAGPGDFFNGRIRDVRLYGHALGEPDIQSLKDSPLEP